MEKEALRSCSGHTERETRVMGSILSFVPRKAASRPAGQPAQVPASIIIFPGVRYERCAVAGAVDERKPDGLAGGDLSRPLTRH